MTAQQRQIDEREHVVGGVVVLGDAECPAELGAVGRGVEVGQLDDRLGRHARDRRRPLGGVGLNGGGVVLEADRGMADEVFVVQSRRR